jgi:hypothetical protein
MLPPTVSACSSLQRRSKPLQRAKLDTNSANLKAQRPEYSCLLISALQSALEAADSWSVKAKGAILYAKNAVFAKGRPEKVSIPPVAGGSGL